MTCTRCSSPRCVRQSVPHDQAQAPREQGHPLGPRLTPAEHPAGPPVPPGTQTGPRVPCVPEASGHPPREPSPGSRGREGATWSGSGRACRHPPRRGPPWRASRRSHPRPRLCVCLTPARGHGQVSAESRDGNPKRRAGARALSPPKRAAPPPAFPSPTRPARGAVSPSRPEDPRRRTAAS